MPPYRRSAAYRDEFKTDRNVDGMRTHETMQSCVRRYRLNAGKEGMKNRVGTAEEAAPAINPQRTKLIAADSKGADVSAAAER